MEPDDLVEIANAARSLHRHFCPEPHPHSTVLTHAHEQELQLELQLVLEGFYGPLGDVA